MPAPQIDTLADAQAIIDQLYDAMLRDREVLPVAFTAAWGAYRTQQPDTSRMIFGTIERDGWCEFCNGGLKSIAGYAYPATNVQICTLSPNHRPAHNIEGVLIQQDTAGQKTFPRFTIAGGTGVMSLTAQDWGGGANNGIAQYAQVICPPWPAPVGT